MRCIQQQKCHTWTHRIFESENKTNKHQNEKHVSRCYSLSNSLLTTQVQFELGGETAGLVEHRRTREDISVTEGNQRTN
jgi:hypothetical protein